MDSQTNHVVIGAGPAGICEIVNLIKNGIQKNNIIWIDPQFKVGDFGTILSKGSSVPGNTQVAGYQRVNKEIYRIVPDCASKENPIFKLNTLNPDFVCSLKVAAEPLQSITNILRTKVNSIKGVVTDIYSVQNKFNLKIKLNTGDFKSVIAKSVVLATGASPKQLKLPSQHSHLIVLDPSIAFIQTELNKFLKKQSSLKTIGVIGSSHSAALATMYLLKAGLSVKQFMNKKYKYATPRVSLDGKPYTQFDNTGLKGSVALFTKKISQEIEEVCPEEFHLTKGKYQGKLIQYIEKDREKIHAYLEKYLQECSHVVTCIGYTPSSTLKINDLPLNSFNYNPETMEFNEFKNLKGRGIAFPQKVTAPSGEIEFAVGVEKFWNALNRK